MGLWQPDVQREHTRLGAEAHQAASAGTVQLPPVLRRHLGGQLRQPGKLQRAQQMSQPQQTHQQRHTADDRHRQIGVRSPQGLGRLILRHPHIGGEGHHLKEHEQGEQIPGQKHPHQGPLGQKPEEVVAVAPLGGGKVGRGHRAGTCPQQCRHYRQQPSQAPGGKVQTQAANPGQTQLRRGKCQEQQCRR